MNKVKLVLICLLPLIFPAMAFSQITILDTGKETIVGRHAMMGTLFLELSMRAGAERDTTYMLTYRDDRYPSLNRYETIHFANKQTVLDFRKIVMSVFTPPNNTNKDYLIQFRINEGTTFEEVVSVGTYRSLGVTSAMVLVSGKGHAMPTVKSHWEKVFAGLN
jgi:hypothetical protein